MKLFVVCVFASVTVSVCLAVIEPRQSCGLCKDAADRSECECCPEPCCCRCTEGSDPGIIPMCTSKLDVIMIVDSSGSIRESGWRLVKDFLKDIVRHLDNVGQDIKVALILFSNNATVEFNLNSPETASKDNLLGAIEALELIGGITNTVEGLELALSDVLGSPYDDPDLNNVLFYFSDGRTSYNSGRLPELADKIHPLARVVSVGVTPEVNKTELNIISSGDPLDETNTFQVDTFDELDDILGLVATRVCTTAPPVTGKECFCCCPPPWEISPKTWFYEYYGYGRRY